MYASIEKDVIINNPKNFSLLFVNLDLSRQPEKCNSEASGPLTD